MPAAALATPIPTTTNITRRAATTASTSSPTAQLPASARPPRRLDGIFGQLNAEWDQLTDSRLTRTKVSQWASGQPALSGLHQLADLTAHRVTNDRTGLDQVLAALLQLHHAGDQLAGRAVLQLMLGEAGRLAGRTTGRETQTPEDHRAHVITCLWEAIANYPADRPRASSAFNRLSLDTLKGVTSRPAGQLEVTVDPGHALELVPDVDDAIAVDERVLTLVHWGASHGHISPAEARLAFLYHSPTQRDHHLRTADLAASEQTTRAALRQRLSRITRRLTAAAREAALNGDNTITALAS